MTKNTKTARLLKFFQNGGDITERQARSRFGLMNLRATVNNLRNQGYAIYANSKTTSAGESITTYRLGAPTRRIVAAGYALLGVEGFEPQQRAARR